MKHFHLTEIGGNPKTYYSGFSSFWTLNKYLWKSPETNEIYVVNSLTLATVFNTKDEALICYETYLKQKKKK